MPPRTSDRPAAPGERSEPGPETGGKGRRRYQRPSLRAYGRLVDVTRFGGSQVVDSGFGLGQP